MLTSGSLRVRGHQGFLRLFLSLLAGLLLAACEPASQSFLSRGIGANLPTTEADMANTQALQRRYFNYLCQEATLSGSGSSNHPSCHLDLSKSRSWNLIVQQGLNDIDRRCDAYLQWLDNRKRSKGPLISQIGAIGATTTGIMGVTGATAEALTIAALAFGLVTQSIENYSSLLLEVDNSTVNSVVLNGRRQFRSYLLQNNVRIDNKPQAEHILRSYLRLCLPFAIETKINNFSTLGSSGEAPDEQNTIGDLPVLVPLQGSGSPVTNDGGTTEQEARKISGNRTSTEANILVSTGRSLQDMLCVTGAGSGTGNFNDAETRMKMKEFEEGLYFLDPVRTVPNDQIDDQGEFNRYRNALQLFRACGDGRHKTAFEAGYFENLNKGRGVKKKLRCILAASTDPNTRTRFAALDQSAIDGRKFNDDTRIMFSLANRQLLNSDSDLLSKQLAQAILDDLTPCA